MVIFGLLFWVVNKYYICGFDKWNLLNQSIILRQGIKLRKILKQRENSCRVTIGT